VVCVTPVWPNIFAAIQIQGGVARHVPMTGTDHGWELDIDSGCSRRATSAPARLRRLAGNPTAG